MLKVFRYSLPSLYKLEACNISGRKPWLREFEKYSLIFFSFSMCISQMSLKFIFAFNVEKDFEYSPSHKLSNKRLFLHLFRKVSQHVICTMFLHIRTEKSILFQQKLI